MVSATGVSGVRYRRQIELSTSLSVNEKVEALKGLQRMLAQVASGEISDFRMIIRGQQRTTHSDSETLSGRAKELRGKGFYLFPSVITRTAANPPTCGTSSLKTPKKENRTLPHTPWTCAEFKFSLPGRRGVLCLIRFAECRQGTPERFAVRGVRGR